MSDSGMFSQSTSRLLLAFSARQWLGMALLFLGLTGLGVLSVYWQVEGVRWQWDNALLAPTFLLAALGLLLVYFAADGLRLWCTLKALGYPIRARDMTQLVFLNIFVSNITPLATGGGVAQVWFLRQHSVPVGKALTATTIRTVLAILMIFAAAPILWSLLPDLGGSARGLIQTGLWLTIGVYAAGFALVLFKTDWLIRTLLALLAGLCRIRLLSYSRFVYLKRHWIREMRRFSRGFRQYFAGGWFWVTSSVVSTAVFLLALFSFPALIFHALGYDLSYWLALAKMVVTTFIMYFSPTPGGSGIAEGVFGRFFSADLLTTHLVLAVVVWRGLTIYLGMLIGLMVTLRLLQPSPNASHAGSGAA
ncbi:lysylphosphatidylglycerol synthase transmembrane domain-containing protein [Hydrogenovibrio halophilus]|uniref:lysylphosphatidylglycerol synthase transmembrane domain-containing protein n=1 Tax=Hydrogenovibrio halophilus TaxID=373391 RepID=UPI001B7F8B4A|nr:lysylphosphatidylglycerol synthase transmembrane domain-containing protein [Hydrogenovibrio halophilus]